MEHLPQTSAGNGGYSPGSSGTQNHQETAAGSFTAQAGADPLSISKIPWRRQFARARNKLVDRRARVNRRRVGLQEKRVGLRRLRQKASKLDASFITALRRAWAAGGEGGAEDLFEMYEKVQEVRDTIGPTEDDYDQEEDDMMAAEYALEGDERHLYNNFLRAPFEDDPITPSPPSSSGYSSLEDEPPLPDPSDPRFQYESRIGDANILRERLDELVFEHAQYLEEKERRETLGLQQYGPNIEFLRTFEKTYDKLACDLQQAEDDIIKLKQVAIEKGLLAESDTVSTIDAMNNLPMSSTVPTHFYANTPPTSVEESTITRRPVIISRALLLIHRWLSGIKFPVERILRTAKMSFRVRDTQGLTRFVRKYCATYFTFLGSRGKQALIQSSPQQSSDSDDSDRAQPLQDDWEDLGLEVLDMAPTGPGFGDNTTESSTLEFNNYWSPAVQTPTSVEEAAMMVSLKNAELRKEDAKLDFDSQSV